MVDYKSVGVRPLELSIKNTTSSTVLHPSAVLTITFLTIFGYSLQQDYHGPSYNAEEMGHHGAG